MRERCNQLVDRISSETPLGTERNHLDYTVTAEVLEYSGGCVGDIEVSEKLVNGFKIAHTGSATEVKLKVFVKGGFY